MKEDANSSVAKFVGDTFANDYYPTFTLPHVTLETAGIDHFDATGIVTSDGRRQDIDTLILATGFTAGIENGKPGRPVQLQKPEITRTATDR